MKTVYILLLLVLTSCANDIVKNNLSGGSVETSESKSNSEEHTISGLKIVTKDSKKLGKRLYVLSDSYTEKEVTFYNAKGKKAYVTKTIGSPIYLRKLRKGTYTVIIVEGENIETREVTVE